MAALTLAACDGSGEVADGANDSTRSGNVDIDVLPPDDSIAVPADELAADAENGDTKAAANGADHRYP